MKIGQKYEKVKKSQHWVNSVPNAGQLHSTRVNRIRLRSTARSNTVDHGSDPGTRAIRVVVG